VAKLNAELRSILALPEVKAAVEKVGVDVHASTPRELSALMKRDYARWGEIVKKNNIKAQ
jgi:tripartite-type tricarboxylate transporter receptor subunit TctC